MVLNSGAQPDAEPRPGWPSIVGSFVALLCAGPVGWLVVIAVGIPADRGEESASVMLGVIGGFAWAVLALVSGKLAFTRRGRSGALIFVPSLLISLGLTVAPLVALALTQ